jgi:hypothetical protein
MGMGVGRPARLLCAAGCIPYAFEQRNIVIFNFLRNFNSILFWFVILMESFQRRSKTIKNFVRHEKLLTKRKMRIDFVVVLSFLKTFFIHA